MHILQLQLALDPFWQRHQPEGRWLDDVLRIEQFRDALGGTRRTLQLADDLAQRTNGTADDQTVENERRQFAPVMRPAITSMPPTHNITATAPSTSTITTVIIQER